MSREEAPESRNAAGDEASQDTGEFLARVRRGDFSALGPLVKRVTPWLERTALLRLRTLPRALAEPTDLVQEAWARTLVALPRLQPHDGNLVPTVVKYAARTIKSRARDLLLHYARRSPGGPRRSGFADSAMGDLPDSTRGIVTRAIAAESHDQLRAAIDTLSEVDREVLLMRAIEQSTTQETALALGVSQDVVRQRYARAKQRLRASLTGSLIDEIDPS